MKGVFVTDKTGLKVFVFIYAMIFAFITCVTDTPLWAKNASKVQGGITCGAIDDPRKSSKAIDERVIINFRDKNVVIARFRDKNETIYLYMYI